MYALFSRACTPGSWILFQLRRISRVDIGASCAWSPITAQGPDPNHCQLRARHGGTGLRAPAADCRALGSVPARLSRGADHREKGAGDGAPGRRSSDDRMGGRAEVPDYGGKPDGGREDGSHVPKDHGTDGGATCDHPRRRVGGRDVPEGLDWVGHVVFERGGEPTPEYRRVRSSYPCQSPVRVNFIACVRARETAGLRFSRKENSSRK